MTDAARTNLDIELVIWKRKGGAFMTREKWKIPEQRGALLVLTALLLPVFFACAGVAVDLGSMYAHKSNLQNAVDAAALAGAAGYIAGEETAEYHPGANTMSDEYLKADLGKGYQNVIDKDFQAQTVSGKTYYRVMIVKQMPTSFMRMVGIKPYVDVSADAVALVGTKASGSPADLGFKDLIAAKSITGLGAIYDGKIYKTFDGNVVALGSSGSSDYLYTAKAYGMTPEQAAAAGNYSTVKTGSLSDYNSFYSSTESKIKALYEANSSDVKTYIAGTTTITGSAEFSQVTASGAVSLTLGNISGGAGKPAYLNINSKSGSVAVTTTKTISRLLVITYLGTGNFNLNIYSPEGAGTSSLASVIYAPYANVTVTSPLSDFSGSIYASNLTIRSTSAYFKYKDLWGAPYKPEVP